MMSPPNIFNTTTNDETATTMMRHDGDSDDAVTCVVSVTVVQ